MVDLHLPQKMVGCRSPLLEPPDGRILHGSTEAPKHGSGRAAGLRSNEPSLFVGPVIEAHIHTDSTVEQLWRAFKRSGDVEARDRLVLQYAPLVKYVAGRIRSGLPPSVEMSDLVSDGVIGLMDAIDKFDLDRGLQFQTYAVPRIRGSIIDALRSSDWVPRSVREKIRAINAALVALEVRLGRVPEDGEVAEELGVSVRDLRATYSQISYVNVVSIDATGPGDATTPQAVGDLPGADDGVPEGLMDALRELPERDQIVVALYYWEHLTLAEIGQVLEVSESRVSQLHSRATLVLRHKLSRRG